MLDLLGSPGGMVVAAIAIALGMWILLRKSAPPESRIAGLVKLGRYGEAARIALEEGLLNQAFDLYIRAQEPQNAAVVAVRLGDLRQAAELYESAANWERAIHFFAKAGLDAKAEELRTTRLQPAPPVAAKKPGEPPVTHGRQLEKAYRAAKVSADSSESARAELQRTARDAADALLADGEIARAADVYADADLDDEAIHLFVNVLGQPGLAAPVLARRGNHERAAELYELAGELERAAIEWVDIARRSPRPDVIIERIAGLSPRIALDYVERETKNRPLAEHNAELHYQHAALVAGTGDIVLAERLYRDILSTIGNYRDVENRLRDLHADPSTFQIKKPFVEAPQPLPPIKFETEQIARIASEVAEAAAMQLRRRVELSQLPAMGSGGTAARDDFHIVGLEQSPIARAFLKDTAVAAARIGPSREVLERFTGGRPCDLGNIEVYYRLGLFHVAHGHYDDAVAAFDAVEDTSPAYRDAWKRAEEIRAWKEALGKASHLAANDGAAGSDRYQLRGELGRGGMAVVYRAYDTLLGRDVALKFLSEELSTQPGLAELFQREARAVASLNHSNIVTIHDTGFLRDRAFLCMEFVDGQSVEALLETRSLTIVESLRVMKQVLDALAYAHERQIVHRDIKPGNIMRTSSGLVKLMDFGLAKSLSESNTQSIIAGTPAYMAPEQLSTGAIDHRSDLFAVAVTLYEMLTGTLPFEGFDRRTLPVPVTELVPALPSSLEEVVMRGMAYERERRWDTAAEMNTRIEQVLAAVGTYVAAKAQPRSISLSTEMKIEIP